MSDTDEQELVSAVAHELRTPVAAVRGAVETLRRRELDLDDATRDRLLGVIARAAAQLDRLVDDLLLAARLDRRSVAVSLEACDLAAVAAEAVEEARLAAPEASIELSAPSGLPPVSADPGRLRQIVANLLANAVMHGGAHVSVEVRLEAREDWLSLVVADDGRGFPAEDAERIFERSYRGGRPDAPGLGLGLYLSRELLRAMGGRISARSTEGEGATFTVELPRAADG